MKKKLLFAAVLAIALFIVSIIISCFFTDSKYQNAVSALNNGDYEQAIIELEKLDNYKDSRTLLDIAMLRRKYAIYNQEENADVPEIIQSAESVEEILQDNFYKTWYDCETGKELFFDSYKLNERYYGVKRALDIDGKFAGVYSLDCYYIDNPEENVSISIGPQFFPYLQQSIECLTIYDEEAIRTYHLITPDEYAELSSQNAEIESRQQIYSDDVIIEKTFSAFKNMVGSYYSGLEAMYHASSYSDPYVTYDWNTKTYTCTLTAQYSTNMFDFYGTSTQTYCVTAQFIDNGSSLTMISFDYL